MCDDRGGIFFQCHIKKYATSPPSHRSQYGLHNCINISQIIFKSFPNGILKSNFARYLQIFCKITTQFSKQLVFGWRGGIFNNTNLTSSLIEPCGILLGRKIFEFHILIFDYWQLIWQKKLSLGFNRFDHGLWSRTYVHCTWYYVTHPRRWLGHVNRCS